jgi:hypothetical protein
MDDIGKKIMMLKLKIKAPYLPYIEVDEGWYQLVLDCDKELSEIDPKYDLQQIKEKFGGLRYYFQPSDPALRDEMDAVVAKYEEIASRTCEATGGPGVLMKSVGSWFKTLNPEFAESKVYYAKYAPVNKVEDDSNGNETV